MTRHHEEAHSRARRWLERPQAAFALDLLSVVVFVAIGRRSHDEPGNVVVGALKVAAPFLIAVAVGWLIVRAWRAASSPSVGVGVWLSTVVIGLGLRRLVFDRGIATAFVIVTTVVLCALMLGWRLLVRRVIDRDRLSSTTSEPARQ